MSRIVLEALYQVVSVTGLAGLKIHLVGPPGMAVGAAQALTDAGALVTVPRLPRPGADLRTLTESNVSALLAADAVVLLGGWEHTAAAATDVLTAAGAGIPCVRLEGFFD